MLSVLLEWNLAGGSHENFQVHFKNIVVCGHSAFSKAASFGRLDPLCQCTQQHQQERVKTSRFLSETAWFVDTVASRVSFLAAATAGDDRF